MKAHGSPEKNYQKDSRKNHLLNDQSFDVLVELQQEIAQVTGWMPTLNKLVNALVNTQTLLYLKEIMLQEFKDRKKQEVSVNDDSNKK